MKVDLKNLLTVTEASNRGVSRLVSDAEYGIEVVVTRNGKPAAGVVSIEKLKRLSEVERAEQSVSLAVLAIARLLTEGRGNTVSLPAAYEKLGIDRGDVISPLYQRKKPEDGER